MTQTFVESCVDFEVAHLSVLMVRRLPYPEIPSLTQLTCTKAMKLVGMLYRQFFTWANTNTVYLSSIRPHLEYASELCDLYTSQARTLKLNPYIKAKYI